MTESPTPAAEQVHSSKDQVGSVLVLGAGIAGMQASLDCANAGLKVYLVEQKPSIGGNMARLDKTFPTNDCAMCMISPKLVETGRHLNIDILSYADLVNIEGEAGNFHVTVRRRARYVDEETCNGCGDCAAECPVNIRDDFNGHLADRQAIYRLYPQAIPNVFTIDKRPTPPCRGTCPAGVNAQGYVGLIAKGKFLEALDLVRERMPFAGTCGRICHHPCEQKCNRAEIDEAVSVRNLKRFVADHERDLLTRGESTERAPSEVEPLPKEDYQETIAIVGGGPAGLTCANNLAKLGYSATVFDANEKLGGMMRTGIPAYRLPRDFLDHEVELIVGEGIEVETGKALGRDFSLDDLEQQGFKATFVATGAQLPRKIPLDGGDAEGVLYGIPFLDEVNGGGKPDLGADVVVIGGGNVATDVARSARRVVGDGTVSLFCLESRDEMPAHDWEIRESEEEDVVLNPSWGPSRIIAENGKVTGIEFKKCTAVFDAEGKFSPQFDDNQTRTVTASTVILAVGQACDLSFVEDALELGRGVIKADPLTLETSRPGVFAGGDNVLGPASLVQATAHGHRAAESIHRFLRGTDLREDRDAPDANPELADLPPYADCGKKARHEPQVAEAAQRKLSFAEIERGFTVDEAVAEAKRCLNCGGCCECFECVRICKARAINHEMKDELLEMDVGAVITTNGYDVFDATRKSEFGFGRYPNVVTSLQFERILSASGPYEGHLQRRSDGAVPKKIAWIQCVGSRDAAIGNDYCSSVCCMYAVKEAIIAKEHESIVEPTIFFTDVRAFGKGFESFCTRAKTAAGVRFVHSQVSAVKEDPETHNLILRYVSEEGKRGVVEEEFDMVVLSVGLVANASSRHLTKLLGIDANRFGFAASQAFEPLRSSREGVFLSGASSGPRDIPETVMQSSAAAALCGELLRAVRGTEVLDKEYPPERDVVGEEPRIGLFVCHCGTNIASVIDVEAVVEYAQSLKHVAHAENTLYTCSQDTQEKIKQIIVEKQLNRLIVASCTPRTHEPLFRETLREAGLNQFLFEMVNIREQCSWVHKEQQDQATGKAESLVRGGVGKSCHLEPLQLGQVPVAKSGLVVGGGIAGMTASLSLARQGYQVVLVEKDEQLGGNLRHVKRGLDGCDWQQYLERALQAVEEHPGIDVRLSSEVDELAGFVGNFTTRLKGSPEEIRHGVTIVATGADEWQPDGFLYGSDERVVTQRQLEARLEGDFAAKTVVMIQCVGSRNEEHEYCSRVCCGAAVKNALTIKKKSPETDVYVLYRDLRTYEFRETYYREAREIGVRFIRFPDEEYPTVSQNGAGLSVKLQDVVLGEELELSSDLVVLSAASVPDLENNRNLAELLKVPLDKDGFFMEAHVKLMPVDFANAGIFVCGLAHSPKYTEENITQALAAAGRAACVLSDDTMQVGGAVSEVNEEQCASCLTCVRECIYNAPFINANGKAEIEPAKCQGCGNCASACPGKAIQLMTFTDRQERALFEQILQPPEPCEKCPGVAEEVAATVTEEG